MLPNVEDIYLSNTAMTRSYMLAELRHLCGTRPKATRLGSGADTRYKLRWPQKQLVAVQTNKSFKRPSHRWNPYRIPLVLAQSRWLKYDLVKFIFATKWKRRTLYLVGKSLEAFRRFSAAKQVLSHLATYCWRQLHFLQQASLQQMMLVKAHETPDD